MSDQSRKPFNKKQQAPCDTIGDICAELEAILQRKRALDALRRVATDFAGRGLVSRQYRDITVANEVPHRHDFYDQPHASFSSRGQPSSSKMFPCDKCGYMAITKEDLREHTYDHVKEDGKMCQICRKVFSTKYGKKVHVETVHKVKKPFHCVHCESKFGRRSNAIRHVRSVHDKETWECLVCHKTFNRKDTASRHMTKMHGTSQPGPLRVMISLTPRQRDSGNSSKDRRCDIFLCSESRKRGRDVK